MKPARRLSFLLIVLFPLLATDAVRAQRTTGSDVPPAFPIDVDRAQSLFELAKRLSDADDGALWGRPLYGPILIVDPTSRAVVANVRDRKRHLRRLEQGVFIGRLPMNVALANTATEWAGRRWSMILWPIGADDTYAGTLMMHECFHRIQPELGLVLAVPDNHHLDTGEGRRWMRLEWRALADALDEETPLACDSLRDALIFRAHRHALFPKARVEEAQLELNEGLAEYTGLRLSGMSVEDQRRWAKRALIGTDRSDVLVRTFAYTNGPPYCQLLDEADPDWRRKVRRSGDLVRLLMRAIDFKPPRDLEAQALDRAGMYDDHEIVAEENAREARRQDRLVALRARYVDGPVLTVHMIGDVNYSFSPYDVRALDGVGSVYGSFQLHCAWGTLDASGGAMMQEYRKGYRRVIVPAGDISFGAPTRGDGWTLHLAEGWRIVEGDRVGDYVLEPIRR